MKKFCCKKCKYVYDESEDQTPSEPDEVFYDRAAFNELPEDWNCPQCGAPKSDFSEAMHYQNLSLPAGASYAASSPEMTEKSVLPGILKKHMAPRGKCGYLVVKTGALQFVWEDTWEIFDAAPDHPIVIAPERYHHVKITGPVTFKIEFYNLPEAVKSDPAAARPGEKFV